MLFGKKNKEEIQLKIEGMHCGMCVSRMQKAFMGQKGVLQATISLEDHSAQIVYDADKITPEQLRQAVADTGYTCAD